MWRILSNSVRKFQLKIEMKLILYRERPQFTWGCLLNFFNRSINCFIHWSLIVCEFAMRSDIRRDFHKIILNVLSWKCVNIRRLKHKIDAFGELKVNRLLLLVEFACVYRVILGSSSQHMQVNIFRSQLRHSVWLVWNKSGYGFFFGFSFCVLRLSGFSGLVYYLGLCGVETLCETVDMNTCTLNCRMTPFSQLFERLH